MGAVISRGSAKGRERVMVIYNFLSNRETNWSVQASSKADQALAAPEIRGLAEEWRDSNPREPGWEFRTRTTPLAIYGLGASVSLKHSRPRAIAKI